MGTVLVVDDDREVRETLVEILKDEGYCVVSASDGQVALNYLVSASEMPRLVLLDLRMPKMNGFRFREEQLKNPTIAAIPIAVLTAETYDLSKTTLFATEVTLRKPIQLHALLKVVHRICGAPKATDEHVLQAGCIRPRP